MLFYCQKLVLNVPIKAFSYTNNIRYLYYLLVLKVFETKIDFFRAGGEKFDLLKSRVKAKERKEGGI